MSDHERIYLEPSPGADEDYGRQWCQHNVWDEATEYVRADLHEVLIQERDRLREALKRMEDCFEQLAATRTHEVYAAMIDSGQGQALLDLDNARRNARDVLREIRP
ncbi:hypothetical protein BMW22_15875 [Rhizobium leguminosarum]|uniref:Uncharacterized protein n=1 Tax=Rhizobium leguminosarum TaxID=384 RepID=A0A1L3ZBE6_RHILE|nr:hypothetical protein [Rhizobium leguminosarum]API52902.1 hypothetical protein BMW22_15875 [Rhizobium leguminosarum]